MLRIPVNDVVVTIDLDHPSVGMGDGVIELQSGQTRMPFPFQIVSENPATVNAADLMAATTQALNDSNIALSPVRVLLAN